MSTLMNEANWEQLVKFHKALGDKTRLRILSLLKVEELRVFEIVEILQVIQPAVSQHIRKLKDAGLVQERRSGRQVVYSLNPSALLTAHLDTLPDIGEEIAKLRRVMSARLAAKRYNSKKKESDHAEGSRLLDSTLRTTVKRLTPLSQHS